MGVREHGRRCLGQAGAAVSGQRFESDRRSRPPAEYAGEPGGNPGGGPGEGGDLRDRPLGEVTRDLMGDISLLVRQEVELACAELAEKGRKVVPGIGMLGGAGVADLAAAGALTAFIVAVLAEFLDIWLATLVTALGLGALAAVLARLGKEKVAEVGSPVPGETVETIKEDVRWAKHRATSARR